MPINTDTGQTVTIKEVNYLVLSSAGGTLVYAIKVGEPLPALVYVIDLSEIL